MRRPAILLTILWALTASSCSLIDEIFYSDIVEQCDKACAKMDSCKLLGNGENPLEDCNAGCIHRTKKDMEDPVTKKKAECIFGCSEMDMCGRFDNCVRGCVITEDSISEQTKEGEAEVERLMEELEELNMDLDL